MGQWCDFFRDRGRNEQVIDLGDAMVLPGIINAHCHLDYTGMAGQLDLALAFYTAWVLRLS